MNALELVIHSLIIVVFVGVPCGIANVICNERGYGLALRVALVAVVGATGAIGAWVVLSLFGLYR